MDVQDCEQRWAGELVRGILALVGADNGTAGQDVDHTSESAVTQQMIDMHRKSFSSSKIAPKKLNFEFCTQLTE